MRLIVVSWDKPGVWKMAALDGKMTRCEDLFVELSGRGEEEEESEGRRWSGVVMNGREFVQGGVTKQL